MFMEKKSSIALLFAFLIVAGCDDAGNSVKDDVVASQVASEGQAASASLYLPGGGALQFANPPKVDEVRDDSRGIKHKSVIFEFAEPIDDVYAAVDAIMKEQGYSAKLVDNSRYKYLSRYQKEGKTVVIGYREDVYEGFSRVSTVAFWWAI